jgi:hypothetical protein
MYFWNTQQLALELQDGKVTEREKMWYLFAWMIGTALVIELAGWVPANESSAATITASIASVAVNIIGLLICYQANSRGDNRDFVVRFICMSWPVTWRLVAALVPVLIFLAVITAIFLSRGAQGPFGSIFDRLFDGVDVLFYVAYYAIIRRWLIKISTTGAEAVQTG